MIVRTILTGPISCQRESQRVSEKTRRDFLKLSACGVVAATTAELATALPATTVPAPQSSEIAVHVTGGNLRYQAQPALAWKTGGKSAENAIELNPGKKFQEMLGFGAAFTDAACYTFNRLDPSARETLFHGIADDRLAHAAPSKA